jgi:hypothetical protein
MSTDRGSGFQWNLEIRRGQLRGIVPLLLRFRSLKQIPIAFLECIQVFRHFAVHFPHRLETAGFEKCRTGKPSPDFGIVAAHLRSMVVIIAASITGEVGTGENDDSLPFANLVEEETVPELMPSRDETEQRWKSEIDPGNDDGRKIATGSTTDTGAGLDPLHRKKSSDQPIPAGPDECQSTSQSLKKIKNSHTFPQQRVPLNSTAQ